MHTDSGTLDGVVLRLLAAGYVEVRLTDGAVRVCFAGPGLRQEGTLVCEGDRVVIEGPEPDGVFRGEIRRVRPEPRPAHERSAPNASLITRSAADGLKPRDQRVDRTARPDWPTGAECAPQVGDVVYCTGGPGTVLRVLGRTGNGSRLLELRLATGSKLSFFAAGANVLLAPRTGVVEEVTGAAAGPA